MQSVVHTENTGGTRKHLGIEHKNNTARLTEVEIKGLNIFKLADKLQNRSL